MERKRSWAIRCVHEAQMHEKNCFLTLTYDDEHLPEDRSLVVSDWQKFAKRVRKKHGPFRFMHCGEYGEEGLRPHYHALIFGLDFAEDSVPILRAEKHPLRISESVQKLWGLGFHTIGEVSFDSAAYVASYVTKQVTGRKAVEWGAYERVDPETGEYWEVAKEYATMSRRPGLGTSWFEKYCGDVYPDNFVVMKGQKFKPPSFYDGLLEQRDKVLHKRMLEQRKSVVRKDGWNMTDERLEVREKCSLAQMRKKDAVV